MNLTKTLYRTATVLALGLSANASAEPVNYAPKRLEISLFDCKPSSLTQEKTNFPSIKIKQHHNEIYKISELKNNEEVVIEDWNTTAITSKEYLTRTTGYTISADKKVTLDEGDKLFVAQIIRRNKKLCLAQEPSTQTLTIQSNVPYSIERKNIEDGKIDNKDINVSFKTEKYNREEYFVFSNDKRIEIANQIPEEFYISTNDSCRKNHYKEDTQQNTPNYITGKVNIEGKVYAVFKGKVREIKKPIPKVPLIVSIPGKTPPKKQEALGLK